MLLNDDNDNSLFEWNVNSVLWGDEYNSIFTIV